VSVFWCAIVAVSVGVPLAIWLLRMLALWLFDHVYLGKAAPWVFGFAIWSWPRKVKAPAPATKEGGK
jgi:hypothetical protein